MHELAIVEQVIEIVSANCGGAKVKRVALQIGKLSAVLPDAVRFAFELASEGTLLEGAVLEIDETPGLARCNACGERFELMQPFGRCSCGGSDLEWLAGQELRVREMEVL